LGPSMAHCPLERPTGHRRPAPLPRMRDDVRAAIRSRYHYGPPVTSRAPRPRLRCLPNPRMAYLPPTARSRARRPATTSATPPRRPHSHGPPVASRAPIVPRSARRFASSEAAPSVLSSEAAPAVLDGSQNDLQATDGPLPQPRTRDDVRVATQKSVVQPCPSPRELRGPCDLPQCSPNSVSMALLV